MSTRPLAVTTQCLSLREYFSAANMKSVVRSFVYEYETPKIVTIHSISRTKNVVSSDFMFFQFLREIRNERKIYFLIFFLVALTCRLIQVLILIYGIVYLMIHKKGYQETNTSIISSITLKVKGIGYNQIGQNQTLVIDGADYIIPPQENNALFLMTNFIRTDQEHERCAESSDEKESACTNNNQCRLNKDFQKANGKWTGRCIIKNNSLINSSQSVIGRCELEGWCPVENDHNVPKPILDALNFTIFVKNFIEFPRFKVIRKNINQNASYLRKCNYDPIYHDICPIFRVGTILDIVEDDRDEQTKMLTYGGVIRVKIDWKCNLDKLIDLCLPVYSFKRLDARFKDEPFSQGFNFRFASHWKHQNQSFRTLTKAFGLRFIISVSGQAGRFDVITLSLNIGSLIGILGLATFICDIVALYVHRSSDVYRQQKFQDVDLNLLRLETLNSLAEGMMSEVARRKHQAHVEEATLTGHVIGNNDPISINNSPHKEKFRRNKENHHQHLYENVSSSTPISSSNHYHQQPQVDITNLSEETPSSSSSVVKQRRSVTTRSGQLTSSPNLTNEKIDVNDKVNINYLDEDSPDLHGTKQTSNTKTNSPVMIGNEHPTRPSAKIETFL